ncbi:MAG TPA: hypothetical protein VF589_02675 [Allosphingosinicella sp.]|jgi:hypothetical protein
MTSPPERPSDADEPALPLPLSTERIESFARRVGMLADLLPRARTASPPGEIAAFARQLYEERRIRDRIFAGDLFGEPAWDIMLDLYAAEEEGRETSLAGACAAAAVPPSTGLRYLNAMLELGLIVSEGGSEAGEDGRVRLSGPSRAQMRQLLGRMIAARHSHGGADEAQDRDEPPPG